MSGTSPTTVPWLADSTVDDLFESFPLAIALLDQTGGVAAQNGRFKSAYGPAAAASASLRSVIREPAPGWRTVRIPSAAAGEVEVRAQVLRVRGSPMLILDDAIDRDLLRQLDQLRGQVIELERLSSTDRLTGAWNRAHLDRVVEAELGRSLRERQPVSLVLLDIDQFKRVNDTHGHQSGDLLLRELVCVIGESIRAADTLFRWGGEEFVVLAPSTGYRKAAALAEKTRRAVEQHRFPDVGCITISLGVAEHFAAQDAEAWFRRVDAALYRAKEGGRNRVCVDPLGSSDLWAQSGTTPVRLVWQEGYECGDPAIDAEHRELFARANALFEISVDPRAPAGAAASALDDLLARVAKHFADEESLLERHRHAHLEAHRRAHAGLLARAADLKAQAAAGKIPLGDLVEFLANTVVAQHLFTTDREVFPLFAGTGR